MHERFIHSDFLSNILRAVYKGVPQRGVLSPILYILYVTDITKGIPRSVHVSQFADDIAIYTKFRSVKRGKGLIEKAVKIIDKNLQNLGLDFAPNKTKIIHFNNKNRNRKLL